MTSRPTNPKENAKPAQSHSKKQVFYRRLISTVCLWGVAGSAFWSASDWIFFILISGFMIGGLVEYVNLFPDDSCKRFRRHSYLLSVLYVGGLFLTHSTTAGFPFGPVIDGGIISALIISMIVTSLHRPLEGRRTMDEITATVFGFIYVVILFGFVARIYLLPLGADEGVSTFYLLYLFAVTKFTDMGAYAIGSLFGRHKMVPNISPGKTWQGFGGAILGAMIASFGCLWLMGEKISMINNYHALILGVVLALTAVVGDLAESIIKRSLGVKDSGNLFPGIGGILDLIDSILFTAPVLFFYLLVLKS